jgi:putative membrane protein
MATAEPKTAEQAVKRTAHEVARQSRNVADQAAETKEAAVRIETSADRTTQLAADRNVLAAERTYAAWVRTGLFALASGLGARALLQGVLPDWLVLVDASALIAFSIFCFGAAIWRQLDQGPLVQRPKLGRIPAPVLIAVNGFLALVSLAAMIGIWFGAPGAAVGQLPPV